MRFSLFHVAVTIAVAGIFTTLWSCGEQTASVPPQKAPSDAGVKPPPKPAADDPPKAAASDPAPVHTETPPKNESIYIGRFHGGRAQTINTVFTARKENAIYQGLIRYEPQVASLSDVPGLPDVLDALNRQQRVIPQQIARVDEESEAMVDNLGDALRSITSYHAYLNPVDGRVVAYDLAMTTGGQPQRFVGHITRRGITVDVFRGGDQVDHSDLPFPLHDTFVRPVEMEFIHQWYMDPAHKESLDKKEPVKFSMFIPEVMGFVMLVVRPINDEVISVGGETHNCAHYDVLAFSSQSSENVQARTEMWFDKRSTVLMKRLDVDPTLKPGEAPVYERGRIEDLKLLPLVIQAPKVPDKPLPYELDQELLYSVTAREQEIGRVRVQFARAPGDSKARFISKATVTVNAQTAARQEVANTWYDENWRALRYEVSGSESADAKASYSVGAEMHRNSIDIAMERKIEEHKPDAPLPILNKKENSPQESAETWHDPLVRVPISDQEAQEQQSDPPAVASKQQMSRPLSEGTFLYDFNRIEHLAVLAHRFPLPAVSDGQSGNDALAVTYQKAAIFSVRQNRATVLFFEIKPEPKPVLTERQKRRLSLVERNEPRLFVANAQSALLPCRILLAPDGRILELTTRHGSGDVTYTLINDPIMRGRAERASKQHLQEGPQLIRPPWW